MKQAEKDFLDIKNETAFLKLFGNIEETDLLLSFLNHFKATEQAEFTNVSLYPHKATLPNESLVVARAEDANGKSCRIEISFERDPWLHEINKPEIFERYPEANAQVDQLLAICITDYSHTLSEHYSFINRLSFGNPSHRYPSHVFYRIIELDKFKKTEKELKNIEDEWLFLMNNIETQTELPDRITNKALKRAYELLDSENWSEEELQAYVRNKNTPPQGGGMNQQLKDYLNAAFAQPHDDDDKAKEREQVRQSVLSDLINSTIALTEQVERIFAS